MTRAASILLWLDALAFLGFGLAFLLSPAAMSEGLDIALPTLRAEIEIRAFYGGLEVGFAAFLALAAMRPSWRQAGLAAAALLLAGTALTRIGGQLAGGFDTLHSWLAALELSGAILSGGIAAKLGPIETEPGSP